MNRSGAQRSDEAKPRRGEPQWEVALLFPPQGEWTEDDYLALDTNRLIELSDGCLEVLPMPTIFHQLLVQFLYEVLKAHVTINAPGLVLVAPLPIRLWAGKLREPDLVYIRRENVRNPRRPPESADLVVEVLSEGEENRHRDLDVKKHEYARAGIPEYWIVDPLQRHVIVLALDGSNYRVHGQFLAGSHATSALLPGLQVDVAALFAAEKLAEPDPAV